MSWDYPYAEDVNYWKTSRVDVDSWIEKSCQLLAEVEAHIHERGMMFYEGREALMLGFSIGEEEHRIVWPVLKSREGNQRAARIQAATFVYHDTKAKCMTAKVLGPHAAFIANRLVGGRSLTHYANIGLDDVIPKLGYSGD